MKNKLIDSCIETYAIIPPDKNGNAFGAKGVILTFDGKMDTEEIVAKTKEEAEQKAIELLTFLKIEMGFENQ